MITEYLVNCLCFRVEVAIKCDYDIAFLYHGAGMKLKKKKKNKSFKFYEEGATGKLITKRDRKPDEIDDFFGRQFLRLYRQKEIDMTFERGKITTQITRWLHDFYGYSVTESGIEELIQFVKQLDRGY